MSSQTIEFLESWQWTMYILAPIAALLGILVYVIFKLLLYSKKDNRSKYDFVSKYEYKFLFVGHALIALSIFFLANNYSHDTVLKSFLWFFIRIFISMCVGVLYGYVAQLMLKYYYPAIQAKRLKKYRFTPRINPANGNTMKLLSEDEEDAYLDEGMQAEENVFSVDYDVWIDSETGDTLIEKYEGRLHALECDRCGFQTLKLEREEIIRQATEHEEGELTKHYKCSYCNRIKRNTVRLSNQKYERDFVINESSRLIDNPLAEDIKVMIVKIEIHGTDDSKKNYEFQNLANAQKFLQEFDYKKLD